MKKNKKLLYAFTTCLFLMGILFLYGCPGNTGTSRADLGIVEGKIVFAATNTQKMGLIMVKNQSTHVLAYGIPYHFNDVANTSTPLTGGSDVKFSIMDDGKLYTATGITKNATPTNILNPRVDFSRMLLLDNHTQSFPVQIGVGGRDHVLGHIGNFMGMARYDKDASGNTTTSTKLQYGVYPVTFDDGNGNINTLYLGLPIVADNLLNNNVFIDATNPWTGQVFYFSLSDVKLTWLQQKSGEIIDPLKELTLVREILPTHWHWYDQANKLPQ